MLLLVLIAALDGCVESKQARIEGRPDAAVAHARACVVHYPTEPDAHIELSRSFGLQENYDAGVRAARTALRLAPNYEAAKQRLAEALRWAAADHERQNDVGGAWSRLQASCDLESCESSNTWWRRLAPIRLDLEQRLFVLEPSPRSFTDTELSLALRSGPLWVVPKAHFRLRDPLGETASTEARGGLVVGYGFPKRVRAELGFQVGPSSSTSLPTEDITARVQFGAPGGLELGAFGRWLQFSGQEGETVIGGLVGCQYFLSGSHGCLEVGLSNNNGLAGWGLARIFFKLSSATQLQLGLGGGNSLDFSRPVPGGGSAANLVSIVGLEWFPDRQIGVELRYAPRVEMNGSRGSDLIHELALRWSGFGDFP